MKIAVNDILVDDKFNCRGSFQLHEVRDLAAGINKVGQLQEIVVRLLPEGSSHKYQLVAGFRRLAAMSQILKWKTVRANVVDVSIDDAQIINFAENLERKDLNPLEEAEGLERAYPEDRYTCRDVQRLLGKHTSWTLLRRKLLKMPRELQLKVATGEFPLSRLPAVAESDNPSRTIDAILNRANKRAPLKELKRRSKAEINQLVIKLHEVGLNGITTRCLAWVNGHITTSDLDKDIEAIVRGGKDVSQT